MMPPTMPFHEFEQAYEHLAEAIDRAGPKAEALFLTKLALTLASKLGDLDTFRDAVTTALQDIDGGAAAHSGRVDQP